MIIIIIYQKMKKILKKKQKISFKILLWERKLMMQKYMILKAIQKKIIKDEKVSLNNISNPFIKAERNYKIVI